MAIAIGNANNPLDVAWHQSFSGVAHATRAVAEYRGKLDPDGCLVRFGSQRIVPGGGLAPDGARWVACKPGFFLPVRVLSRLFRRPLPRATGHGASQRRTAVLRRVRGID